MEPLSLSLLNDYLYCPRRAALKVVEGWRGTNYHTILGDQVHENADLPGYEVERNVILWRALPVWSERFGLSGKCDIVEVRLHPGGRKPSREAQSILLSEIESLAPVEYKKGKRRVFENDDAQLCAQALCLEEMFGIRVESGAVFHAASKRRRAVIFSEDLRQLTEAAISSLRTLAENETIPVAVLKPACVECSLYDICLPQVTSLPPTLQRNSDALFQV